jgi:hypothetical protein
LNILSSERVACEGRRVPLDTLVGNLIVETVPHFAVPIAKYLEVKDTVIEQSLMALLHSVKDGYPTLVDYRKAFWILSANVEPLRSGVPVSPFEGLLWPTWVPVAAVDWVDYKKDGCGTMTFLCLGGVCASETFVRTMPLRSLRFGLKHMFGLPRRSSHCIRETVGMRTWVYLFTTAYGYLDFDYHGCNPCFYTYNRKLAHDRLTVCPLSPTFRCLECYRGLDQCRRSTHYVTHQLRRCRCCGDEQAQFHPRDTSDAYCISCSRLTETRRKLRQQEGVSKDGNVTGRSGTAGSSGMAEG